MSPAIGAPQPVYFKTPAAFRRWLAKHHDSETELWVLFHKKSSGLPSMTWPEAVDQALCFGWIDGVVKSVDTTSYMQRFTPRKPTSNWSLINVAKVQALTRAGLMEPAGLAAFEKRTAKKTGRYSFEQEDHALGAEYEKRFRKNAKAWRWFEEQPPWYRRTTIWLVVSAKKEETRLRRLDQLIAACSDGVWIGPAKHAQAKQPAKSRAAAKPTVKKRKRPTGSG